MCPTSNVRDRIPSRPSRLDFAVSGETFRAWSQVSSPSSFAKVTGESTYLDMLRLGEYVSSAAWKERRTHDSGESTGSSNRKHRSRTSSFRLGHPQRPHRHRLRPRSLAPPSFSSSAPNSTSPSSASPSTRPTPLPQSSFTPPGQHPHQSSPSDQRPPETKSGCATVTELPSTGSDKHLQADHRQPRSRRPCSVHGWRRRMRDPLLVHQSRYPNLPPHFGLRPRG